MINSKFRIVFFGSGSYTIPIIEKLKPLGLVLAITTERDTKLTRFLEATDIPYVTSNLKDPKTVERIKALKPDVGVLASYGVFIPEEVIKLFPKGIINVHPSLLPKHKGPSPVQYTILSGDEVTGVTLIRMDNELDHGDILAQQEYVRDGRETTKELLHTLFSLSADMIGPLLHSLEQGKQLTSIPQDHSKETWSEHLTKESGKISIANPPDKDTLYRMTHAYYPWPGVWFFAELQGGTKRIKLLPGKKIQVEGKNVMGYKDFANGYGHDGRKIIEKLTN